MASSRSNKKSRSNKTDVEMKDVDDDSNSEGEDQFDTVQEVLVDFEAQTAEEDDYHGIKTLLSQLFFGASVDIGEMADTIISQNYVGSVLKQVDDDVDMDDDSDEDVMDTVLGITTAINLTERKALKCVKELKTYLLAQCPKDERRDELKSLLEDSTKSVGLLINERFTNIPAKISVPTFKCLWEECAQATSKKMNYNFTHFVMVSKTYLMSGAFGGKKKKNQNIERAFVNAEEELFFEESSMNFDMMVMASESGDNDDRYRTVMVIPAEKIPTIHSKMTQLLTSK